MEMREFFRYKNTLMKDLCTDAEIVRLVTHNDDAQVPNHQLPYTQIFPYEFVPDAVSDAKTFICFDVDIGSVSNKTYYIPVIYVWVFTHKSLMRTDNGHIIIDELASLIDRKLEGNRFYTLTPLKLSSCGRFEPTTDYLGRELVFTADEFNRTSRIRPAPSNRAAGV